MTLQQQTQTCADTVRVRYEDLHACVRELFTERGIPPRRAHTAASALCHGDLQGFDSHGVFNLSRLYLPLFASGRVDPAAEPEIITDTGACAVVDSRRALGLWSAAEAMDTAIQRAGQHGIGLVSIRDATHFGCAGYHAARAAEQGMVGIVASNCGGQRIARPPLGALTMLGTNPLAVAAPALTDHPFVLDMSTTVVPTGKVRTAASRGETIPPGWLTDEAGNPVTDPTAFDRGLAHLGWLGGSPETGAYKGYGLGLVVELLAALLPGANLGPAPAALQGDGGPHGRDDGIGFFVLAIAPDLLRPDGSFGADAHTMFDSLASCPPAAPGDLVRYPGWWEAERAFEHHHRGVPIPVHLHRELLELGLPDTRPAGDDQ
ncbi:Ldh family oxidoreductase [Saccharopolyspora erythraea]|uniref:Ldh family oxidoreductase n=1 Tax=Saccharopolyspora erythraea TaxID=1836 RepID=UPI001BA7ACD9|nr:Ldh family oxidoreductase [Saccharopolyspora erythraea]QUH04209.1 Ldh family oxidoreductase [Saccharopolyspora erythraea]